MWYLEVHFNTCIDYFDGENAGAFAFIWSRAGKSLKFGGGGGAAGGGATTYSRSAERGPLDVVGRSPLDVVCSRWRSH